VQKLPEHTKVYFEAFGYDIADNTTFIPCEISGFKAVDIHHIVNREDRIENLMAFTRKNHDAYGEIKYAMAMLLKIHRRYLQMNGVSFDPEWFEKYINKYEPYEYKKTTK